MTGAEFFVAAAIASVAGATVSAIGTIQQGKEQQRQANFQAQQAELQSKEEMYASNVAATNAKQGAADAQESWSDILRQRDRTLGTQRSTTAKSGLTFSGSAGYVAEDTALNFQREANRTLFSGLNQSGNYRYESSARGRSSINALSTASNFRTAGRSYRTNSYWQAGGQFISGLGSASMSAGMARTA